jgi:hypothetical protein
MPETVRAVQVIGVGRLLRRNFLRVIAELQALGIDIHAEVVSTGLLDVDYKVTLVGPRDDARTVDRVFSEMM